MASHINSSLQKYLDKVLKQPTVILCFQILLENVIENGRDSGLTKSQIAKAFNRSNKNFGIQNFKTDYILRQTGIEANALFESDKKFFIREDFLYGMTEADLEDLVLLITKQYTGIAETRQKLYQSIVEAKKLSASDRRTFILNMLLFQETERKGQAFEVAAYAILKTLYSIRGFELNRFSTIYSNDGGIDFTSQTSIYQVTTSLTDKKFDEDIVKAPLKKRIFVFRTSAKGFDFQRMENELVSDYISSSDLENHLDYLLSKKPETNSSLILEAILQEFEREHYL